MPFEPGQRIIRRNLYPDGRIGSVLCGRVVADDEDGLAMWVDAGSQKLRRVDLAGQPTRSLSLLTELRMTTVLSMSAWQPFRTLVLMPPARPTRSGGAGAPTGTSTAGTSTWSARSPGGPVASTSTTRNSTS
jgi:hypothetical protein